MKIILMRSLFLTIFVCFFEIHIFAQQNLKQYAFMQSCASDKDENYFQQNLTFEQVNENEFRVIWKFQAFEDKDCKVEYLTFIREYRTLQNLELGSDKLSFQLNEFNQKQKLNDDLRKIKLISTGSYYISLTDEVTQALQLIKYCGFRNWKTFDLKNVTGRKCDDYQQLYLNEVIEYEYFMNNEDIFWNGYSFRKL